MSGKKERKARFSDEPLKVADVPHTGIVAVADVTSNYGRKGILPISAWTVARQSESSVAAVADGLEPTFPPTWRPAGPRSGLCMHAEHVWALASGNDWQQVKPEAQRIFEDILAGQA